MRIIFDSYQTGNTMEIAPRKNLFVSGEDDHDPLGLVDIFRQDIKKQNLSEKDRHYFPILVEVFLRLVRNPPDLIHIARIQHTINGMQREYFFLNVVKCVKLFYELTIERTDIASQIQNPER